MKLEYGQHNIRREGRVHLLSSGLGVFREEGLLSLQALMSNLVLWN